MRFGFVLISLIVSTLCYGEQRLKWNALPELPSTLGVAGPFTGIHEDTLIVAGGANFPEPVWENDKVWHDQIYTLSMSEKDSSWITVAQLPRPLGYGACVSLPTGVLCVGGNDANSVYDEVFLIKRDGSIENWQALPEPNVYGVAAILGDYVYLLGGTTGLELRTASDAVYRLNWKSGKQAKWEKFESLPGGGLAFASVVAQHNGQTDCLYLLGGRYENQDGKAVYTDRVYELNPEQPNARWRKRASMPKPFAAGTASALGQSHIITLSGDDGSLFGRADELKDDHPGFSKESYLYHTITDTWVSGGQLESNQVTTHAVTRGDDIYLASGELRPRVRSKKVWHLTPVELQDAGFSKWNWVAIIAYLGAVMGIGFFFSRRNKDTDDFFRGGQRIPGWVAGLSIFATLLSSITFVATPARAFATDWSFMLINAGILICAPFIVFVVLPYFRKINATSAYEYLEQRFNLAIRLFASLSFILFQIGRMAIVMYLPALALAAITPLSLSWCIIIMGLMSIIYCSLGGLEAVVWTDALQAIVLLGGAFISFGLILSSLEGGWSEYTRVGLAYTKFRLADFDWSQRSYMVASFWVVLISGIGQSLIPYSSDQAVVQRYVSTSTEAKARSAIWLNAAMALVGTLLFFGLGTALYVFYKSNPALLDPSFKTDSIFPLFISRELPVGIAGIVIAAIFAAAQSTISTSMNSTSTAIVTDFFRRLGWRASESSYLKLARGFTVLLGVMGTAFALVLAIGNIESVWKTFMMVIGFVMGPLCGVFLLGMLTKSANSVGAIAGAISGVSALVATKYLTPASGLLYAPIGILVTFAVGWVASRFLKYR